MSARRRILYVVPNQALGENVAEILDGLDYEAEIAPDGHTALDRLSTCDLLLTELRLPDMDALELLRIAHHRHPTVPIIVLNAWAPDARLRAAESAGANSILTFPFRVTALEKALARWL